MPPKKPPAAKPPQPPPLTPTPAKSADIKPAHDTPPAGYNTIGKIVPQTKPAPKARTKAERDADIAKYEQLRKDAIKSGDKAAAEAADLKAAQVMDEPKALGDVAGEAGSILSNFIGGGIGKWAKKPPVKPVSATPAAAKPNAPAAGAGGGGGGGKGGGYSTGAKKVKRKPKRRCELVPYNELECEKGQEAHHVIPDWMLRMGKRGGSERIPDMPSLAEGPAICLEGGSGNEHNTAHKHTDRPAQRVGKNGKSTGVAGTITLGQGKAISSRAIEKATGGKKGGGCSRKDIQKQLDEQFTAQNDAILRGVKDSRKVTDSIKDALNGGKD